MEWKLKCHKKIKLYVLLIKKRFIYLFIALNMQIFLFQNNFYVLFINRINDKNYFELKILVNENLFFGTLF